MRIRTLVAATDTAYTGHISDYISEHHADTLEISVCNTAKQLRKMLSDKRYDVALMDYSLFPDADLSCVNLPMLLWTSTVPEASNVPENVRQIKKHKRISATVADVLQQYSIVGGNTGVSSEAEANITAVWSPVGGAGKTTVALAYAASLRQSKTAVNRDIFYLNMEPFASTGAFFNKQGGSISTVLEMLDNKDGNLKMFVKGVRSCENGIWYLSGPDNYDDICILSPENVRELVAGCAGVCDELVIDLPCACDSHTRLIFELADSVLLVTQRTDTAMAKLTQFTSQCDVYEKIKDKTTLIINKDITETGTNKLDNFENISKTIVSFPVINATDERSICTALAVSGFGE